MFASLPVNTIARVIPLREVVSCRLVLPADVPVQPEDIVFTAGFVVFLTAHVVPEDLPIGVRTTPASSILRQVHRAANVIVVKAVAHTAVGSGFGVIHANEKLGGLKDVIGVATPGPLVVIQTKGRVLNHLRRIGKFSVLVDQAIGDALQTRTPKDLGIVLYIGSVIYPGLTRNDRESRVSRKLYLRGRFLF